MRFRWLFFDYIPPGITIDPDLRRDIRLAVRAHSSSPRATWPHTYNPSVYRKLAVLALIAFAASSSLWLRYLGVQHGYRLLIHSLLMGAAYVGVIALLAPVRARRTYVELRLRGIDVCYNCGYWLQPTPKSDRCPECGALRQSLLKPPPLDPLQVPSAPSSPRSP